MTSQISSFLTGDDEDEGGQFFTEV